MAMMLNEVVRLGKRVSECSHEHQVVTAAGTHPQCTDCGAKLGVEWIGNAIKYLWRAGLKVEANKTDDAKQIEDLRKAVWYIEDEIERLQAQKENV